MSLLPGFHLTASLIAIIIGIAATLPMPGPYEQGLIGNAQASERTVEDILFKYATDARTKIIPYYDKVGMIYPPEKISLLAIKDAGELEVWAGSTSSPSYIRSYTIQSLSGTSGPKLEEGDKQVPEGVYQISGLNPNSTYHLSIKLNYPNAFDAERAREDNRKKPGSNIFIHGKARSIGCLAMGDKAIEELFVLAADVGKENIKVVIAPTDPRRSQLIAPDSPGWVADLYKMISDEFAYYK